MKMRNPFNSFEGFNPVLSSVVLPSDSRMCLKPAAKFNPDKPGMAEPDYSDQVLLQEVIDSYKEQTGLAYALRQINSGRLLPSQLADKGDAGYDLSVVPDNVNDSYRLAEATHDDASRIAEALGIDHVDPDHIEEALQLAIDRIKAKANPIVEETEK